MKVFIKQNLCFSPFLGKRSGIYSTKGVKKEVFPVKKRERTEYWIKRLGDRSWYVRREA